MDAQVRFRLLLYASVFTLIIIAATQPASQTVVLYALLVPFAFVLAAAFLLGGPFLAMEHAEGERVGWRRALDFLEHNSALAFLDLMLLWTTAFVAGMAFAQMAPWLKVAYVVVAMVGFGAALTDWFLTQQRDAKQARWQEHPGS